MAQDETNRALADRGAAARLIHGTDRTYDPRSPMRPHEPRLPLCALAALLLPAALCAQDAKQEPFTADPAQRPRPKDAPSLFHAMAWMLDLEARFEEEKHLSLLAVPLKSKGRLFFHRPDRTAPGYLTRVVDEPEPSTVQISPTELRMENRDGVEVVDLKRSDKVRAFVTSLVQVFAGDETALAKTYTVRFEIDAKSDRAWTLTLVPRDKPLNQMMQSLQLFGEGEAIVRIEMHEPGGDRTVTRIVAADPKRQFDAKEKQRLFRIEAR